MARHAFKMYLFEGKAEEYKRRHDALWPDLQSLLKDSGISQYSIFLDEATHTLFGVMEVADEVKRTELPNHPVMKEWWTYMKDLMETNPDESPVSVPLREVFFMP
ncbi:L-rhamnose mutarotase [Rhabdobacter roseus]|uniref:L-rhamnose mutarotase n=1 Tax=Rhabdobacter roseus TaxID=1655419 RepID=A0A840TFA8_9BACT|nr:L-rhamnose mutarotase [Rhabdobacter roseus]MBB5282806.1 L-rhamnose mutarotase [Rhabdobacter roseus]